MLIQPRWNPYYDEPSKHDDDTFFNMFNENTKDIYELLKPSRNNVVIVIDADRYQKFIDIIANESETVVIEKHVEEAIRSIGSDSSTEDIKKAMDVVCKFYDELIFIISLSSYVTNQQRLTNNVIHMYLSCMEAFYKGKE